MGPAQAVKPGDYILDVKGVKGDAKTMKDGITNASGTVNMLISRKTSQFAISLKKGPNETIGCDVDTSSKDSLKIASIKQNEGLLANWNQSNSEKVVKPGDRIISVNGTG